MSSLDKIEVLPFTRSATEVAALRRVAEQWQREFKFWSFDETLQVLQRSICKAWYIPSRDEHSINIAAIVIVDIGPFEAEVLYIFVDAGYRAKGLGRHLLSWLVEHLRTFCAVEALFLEVRVSNTHAQRLYEQVGMQKIAMRKKYYANGEDAFVYKLAIRH